MEDDLEALGLPENDDQSPGVPMRSKIVLVIYWKFIGKT
jgi:hypothetical protein